MLRFSGFFFKDFIAEGVGMEKVEQLDFDGFKGVRKPWTFSVRKLRLGGSHAMFLNEYEHSSPSNSPPSDP